MNIKAFTLTLLTIFFICNIGLSQDKIYKKNQDIIECTIREVGTDYVKYILSDYPQDVLFSIDADQILKIVFSTGQEKYFQNELTNPDNYTDNKKNVIKLDFISPLTGNTTFAYERSLKPGRSMEMTLGIIGLGIDPDDINQAGFFMKFGYKFIKSPDFYFNRMRYSHILKGGYVRPEISFGYYSYDTPSDMYGQPSERRPVFTGAIHLIIGKQWIFDNVFLVDFFGGIGYGFSDDDNREYQFGYVIASPDIPVSFTAGLKIGVLF